MNQERHTSGSLLSLLPAGYYELDQGGRTILSHAGQREFNHGVKRGETVLVTGDRPRWALLTFIPAKGSNMPSFAKLGDGRIRLSQGGSSIWLDEMAGTTTRFLPGATEYECQSPAIPGLKVTLLVTQAADWGSVTRIRLTNTTSGLLTLALEWNYGGLAVHERTMNASYFQQPIVTDAENDQATTQGVMVHLADDKLPFQAMLKPVPDLAPIITGNRATYREPLTIEPGRTTERALIVAYGTTGPDAEAHLRQAEPERLIAETEKYYADMLAAYAIDTPSPVLDGGFIQGLLNLEYEYTELAWLEGVHWWAGFFPNQYQMAAATTLGQFGRVRRALELFGLQPGRHWRWYLCLASQDKAGASLFDKADMIAYYIDNALQYYAATGDHNLFDQLWPHLVRTLRETWEARDPDRSGLASWHFGCNCYLYQADSLSLPNEAFSPGAMLAGEGERLARLGRTLGKDAEQTRILEDQARRTNEASVRTLWNADEGCFDSHLDHQSIRHGSHYYTDFVFPMLYTSLDPVYGWLSLERLRQTLLLDGLGPQHQLMRVGNLKVSMFGNDNVMPVQMAEAARAFYREGDRNLATNLLDSVALAATVFTDAPGNFPERMSDQGMGTANFIFGPPTGSFLYGVVDGLFGLALEDGGRTFAWRPGFPEDWDHASLKLPYAELSFRMEPAGAGVIKRYTITGNEARVLRFNLPLAPGHVRRVTHNGAPVEYKLAPGLECSWLTIDAANATMHEIVIETEPLKWPAPESQKVTPGQTVAWDLPGAVARVMDLPSHSLTGIKVTKNHVSGQASDVIGGHPCYVEMADPPVIRRLRFEIQPAYQFSCEKAIGKPAGNEIVMRLRLQANTPLPADARLRVACAGQKTETPLAGAATGEMMRDVSLPIPSGLADAVYPVTCAIMAGEAVLFQDTLKVTPQGADPQATADLSHRRESRTRTLDLQPYYNAETITLQTCWGLGRTLTIDRAALSPPDGTGAGPRVHTDWGDFSLPAQGPYLAMIELGVSDGLTGVTKPSARPRLLTVPVGERAAMLTLLYANEMQSRNTLATVGHLRLHYGQGADEIVPLTGGREIDHFFEPYASEARSILVKVLEPEVWKPNLKALRLPCDSMRTLVSFTVEADAADFEFGLLGAQVLILK